MNKTLEELREEFLEWEANGVPLRAYVGREEALDALIAKAQEVQREADAKVCDSLYDELDDDWCGAIACAEAIRGTE